METIQINENKYDYTVLGTGLHKFKLLDTVVENIIKTRFYSQEIKQYLIDNKLTGDYKVCMQVKDYTNLFTIEGHI